MFEGYAGKRVKKGDWEPGNIPYVTATVTNNGIDGYIGNPIIVKENILTVNFFGDVFYQGGKVSFKDGTYGLKLRNNCEECRDVYLGIATHIQKQTKQMGSYDDGLRLDDIKNIILELPVVTNDSTVPYWDYMAYFIHNIKQQYADKLEAKSEYELDLMCQLLGVTREDIKERVPYIEPKYTNKFTVGELFVINRGDISNQGNLVETGVKEGVAFIAQNDSNNGYVKHVEPESYKVYQGRNIVIGRQTGAVYYQDEEYVTTDGVLVLSSKHILDKEIGWYLVTIIKKHLGHSGYNNTVSATKLNKIELELPVLAPNSKQIDWGAIRHVAVGGGINYLATRQEICNRDLAIIRQLIQ